MKVAICLVGIVGGHVGKYGDGNPKKVLDIGYKHYKKHILDVGAYNGIDGLALAKKNPDTLVNAFEANKNLIKTITKLKKKIEQRIGRTLKNYNKTQINAETL